MTRAFCSIRNEGRLSRAHAGLRRDRFREQITVLAQPGIEIHAAAEITETVIGQDKQKVILFELALNSSDEVVHAEIHLVNHMTMLIGISAAVCRMVGIVVAGEHVLNAVRSVEDADRQSARHSPQRVEQHPFPLVVNGPSLFQKRLFADDAGIESPCIFRQSQRPK
jgi:hypothetical protein